MKGLPGMCEALGFSCCEREGRSEGESVGGGRKGRKEIRKERQETGLGLGVVIYPNWWRS